MDHTNLMKSQKCAGCFSNLRPTFYHNINPANLGTVLLFLSPCLETGKQGDRNKRTVPICLDTCS